MLISGQQLKNLDF